MNKKSIGLFLTLFLPMFSLFLFGTGDIKQYLENPDFSKNSTVIEAKILSSKKSRVMKRKVYVDSYFMSYVFSVKGKEYHGGFTPSKYGPDKYLFTNSVTTTYKIDDPNINMATDEVVTKSIADLLSKMSKSFFGMLIIAYFITSFISSKLGWTAN